MAKLIPSVYLFLKTVPSPLSSESTSTLFAQSTSTLTPAQAQSLSYPGFDSFQINQHIRFSVLPFCFIRTSHTSLLLPTSPLNSSMVFISSNWPPVVPLGAQLLEDTFRSLSLTLGTDLPRRLPTCLASSRPLLCLFMPQQDGNV